MRDLSTLPKVELHLHLEGTLEPETVLELGRRNNVKLPAGRYEFTDLQSFPRERALWLVTSEAHPWLPTAAEEAELAHDAEVNRLMSRPPAATLIA